MAGGSLSATAAGFGSTATDLYQMSNLSATFGGSVGEVLVIGRGTSLTKSGGQTIWTQTGGGGIGFNLGVPAPPAEIQAGLSWTAVWAVSPDPSNRTRQWILERGIWP
jgi:hypothetical protein